MFSDQARNRTGKKQGHTPKWLPYSVAITSPDHSSLISNGPELHITRSKVNNYEKNSGRKKNESKHETLTFYSQGSFLIKQEKIRTKLESQTLLFKVSQLHDTNI